MADVQDSTNASLPMDEKFTKLKEAIRSMGSVAVAFSGGVDSSFLARVAFGLLGKRAAAVTYVTPLVSGWERGEAVRMAALIGIRHIVLTSEGLESEVAANPSDRCYYCKRTIFRRIKESAAEQGYAAIVDGSNYDDGFDYRPGLAALREEGIASPLKAAGLTKSEIRELSRRLGLDTWDKPAMACLGSRFPYGETITPEGLSRVERSEAFLRSLGLRQFRVRSHKEIGRIEVAPEERGKFFDLKILDRISEELKSYGFQYVCLEAGGFVSGSMNLLLTGNGVRVKS
jgi:pyridinium-3,5-biscarboxylic acid mononucleotide sulfurtransferase